MIAVKNFIWDEWNRKHIARHNITPEEIEEICHGRHQAKESYRNRILITGKTKADKQRNLAVLVLLAYQEGLSREWVSSTLLAEAASHSKLYDTSKFAKNLKFDWFRFEGVKKGLKYKLSGPGTSHAKKLLAEMLQ